MCLNRNSYERKKMFLFKFLQSVAGPWPAIKLARLYELAIIRVMTFQNQPLHGRWLKK